MPETRFQNCPICRYYHTDYPYCDMCIEGNKFEYADENLKTESTTLGSMSVSCLICGAPVPMENPRDYPKICEKCKKAVMHVREKIENDPERFIDEYLLDRE